MLAQVLDYAAHLPRVGMEGLPDVPEGFADPEDVARHVAERDYLLVIAGDELEDRMASLSAVLLGKHLIHPWSLALVELSPYATVEGASGPEILLVPSLRKAVIAESRNVVRIDTRTAQYEDNRVTVNVSFNIEEADLESTGGLVARKAMTEEEFWTRLRTQPAETVASVENLVAFGERLGLVKRWGAGSMIFDLPQAGASPPLEGVFFIRKGGEVVVWPNTLEGRLRRLGIQLDTARYRDAVVEALRCPPDRREPSGKLDEHGLELFQEATAAFVAEVRSKLE